MKNWTKIQLYDFLKMERTDCYWFWFKGKITRIENRDTTLIYQKNLSSTCEWNGIRFQNGFNHCFNILFDKYMRGLKEGKYNGQTKSEFEKNYKRVEDIVTKSDGDKDKAIRLSHQQALKITDEWKAINRAMVARELGQEEIFEVFFQRAYELGSVSKLEYRQYKLDKLGI